MTDTNTIPLYRAIARALGCVERARAAGNTEWLEKHRDRLHKLVSTHMPSGAGVDFGTKLDESSTQNRLVFTFSFHHMNENGYYDGWTEHTCVVTASLEWGVCLRITGRNRNDIKDYLHDTFDCCLTAEVSEY